MRDNWTLAGFKAARNARLARKRIDRAKTLLGLPNVEVRLDRLCVCCGLKLYAEEWLFCYGCKAFVGFSCHCNERRRAVRR